LAYPIDEKIVIAIASSALFDLTESDRIFREKGVDSYRIHQRENENNVLQPGVAYPLITRILGLNGPPDDERPVEVVLLSQNDPDTGLRVFKSIQAHKLDISRAAFLTGSDPFRYMEAFNAILFLSANLEDVKMAISNNRPAGAVYPTKYVDESPGGELRIAFDFDGVIADDSAEAINKQEGLDEFQQTESEKADTPLDDGPLIRFFLGVASLQERERKLAATDDTHVPRLRIAIVTARSAPAHERMVTTIRKWGIQVDEVFFLGGIDKTRILKEYRPHIFFDDHLSTVEGTSSVAPSAHVPFGVANERAADIVEKALSTDKAGQG